MMIPPGSTDQTLLGDDTPLVSRQFAWRMFGVLFAMNLIDYVDRYVLNAVLPEIQMSFKMKYSGGPAGDLFPCQLFPLQPVHRLGR